MKAPCQCPFDVDERTLFIADEDDVDEYSRRSGSYFNVPMLSTHASDAVGTLTKRLYEPGSEYVMPPASAIESHIFKTIWPAPEVDVKENTRLWHLNDLHFRHHGIYPHLYPPKASADGDFWESMPRSTVRTFVRKNWDRFDTLILVGNIESYRSLAIEFANTRWRSYLIGETENSRSISIMPNVAAVDLTAVQLLYTQTIRVPRWRRTARLIGDALQQDVNRLRPVNQTA